MPLSDDASADTRRRRDGELGAVMRAWVDDAARLVAAELQGPLDAPGMDPRWILKIRSEPLEADVLLFYGPVLDVSAFRPSRPASGAYVGGAENLSDNRMVEMLNDLEVASYGGDLPGWLRSIDA